MLKVWIYNSPFDYRDVTHQTPIMQAVYSSNLEALKDLLESQPKTIINHTNNQGNNAIHMAVIAKKYIVMNLNILKF